MMTFDLPTMDGPPGWLIESVEGGDDDDSNGATETA